MDNEPGRCIQTFWNSMEKTRCPNRGTSFEDGLWYCSEHSPKMIAKRAEAQQREYDLSYDGKEITDCCTKYSYAAVATIVELLKTDQTKLGLAGVTRADLLIRHAEILDAIPNEHVEVLEYEWVPATTEERSKPYSQCRVEPSYDVFRATQGIEQ